MYTKEISLMIESVEFRAAVTFRYDPPLPAVIYADPNSCHPEEPGGYEFEKLIILAGDDYPAIDLSGAIPVLFDDLVDALEIIND